MENVKKNASVLNSGIEEAFEVIKHSKIIVTKKRKILSYR